MRILVMGAGAIGGYIGGLLARAGEAVTLVARGRHLAALQSRGLEVRTVEGDFHLMVPSVGNPAEAGEVDLVLFTVKTYDVDEAGRAITPVVGPATSVLCLENGVDIEDRLGALVGPEAVLGGVTYVSSEVVAPGVIHQTGTTGEILFGEMDGRITSRTEAIAHTFRRTGLHTEVRPDILRVKWEKFLFIVAMSGMSAASRAPMGVIMAYPESRAMCRGLMEEAVAVGSAQGLDLDGMLERQWAFLEERVRSEPGMRASLYQDLAAGKRMELDALAGAVVRMGRAVGVPTPLNFAVLGALRPHQPPGTAWTPEDDHA
jgi:2-dehydropantoate 2-reductase